MITQLTQSLSIGLLTAALIGGCSTAPVVPPNTPPPIYSRDRMVLDDVQAPLTVNDPWELMNRTVYRFNARVDDYVLNPLVAGYRRILPGFARQGVTNFFDNLDDIRTWINQGLQLKGRPLLDTSARFVTNTTVGLLGFFDVASAMGITKHDEDFGQTLGHYGVDKGPYLVLPLFGPSTLRDGLGRAADSLALSVVDPLDLNDHPKRNIGYYPSLIVDTRATTAFQYYETGSPFEYELVRLLFVTKRQLDIDK